VAARSSSSPVRSRSRAVAARVARSVGSRLSKEGSHPFPRQMWISPITSGAARNRHDTVGWLRNVCIDWNFNHSRKRRRLGLKGHFHRCSNEGLQVPSQGMQHGLVRAEPPQRNPELIYEACIPLTEAPLRKRILDPADDESGYAEEDREPSHPSSCRIADAKNGGMKRKLKAGVAITAAH
jgi:hypothetical protein